MESVIKQLVKIGHGMSAEVATDEPAVAKLLVELSSALDVQYERANALEAKCAALAAENAGLKSDHVRIFNSGYQRGHEATVEGYYVDIHQSDMTTYHEDIVAEIEEEQTPATESFLAEVLAIAVDEVCLKISNAIVNCYQDEQIGLDAAATICGDLAAQLRQEAAQ